MTELDRYKELHLRWRQLDEIRREALQTCSKIELAEAEAADANDAAFKHLNLRDKEQVKRWLKEINAR